MRESNRKREGERERDIDRDKIVERKQRGKVVIKRQKFHQDMEEEKLS